MSTALGDRAEDNLRFIRDTMARAGAFTSVSGSGMIAVGAVGLAASAIAPPPKLLLGPQTFLAVWIPAAIVASTISWAAIRVKAARTGQSLLDGPSKRFALAFLPGLVAGAVITAACMAVRQYSFLPGVWLTLYGASVAAGGALSVRPVPIMGALFILLGTVCFFVPQSVQGYFLAAGFGGLHLAFGYHITRHYGG